jgi:hypothetical protein
LAVGFVITAKGVAGATDQGVEHRVALSEVAVAFEASARLDEMHSRLQGGSTDSRMERCAGLRYVEVYIPAVIE